MVTRYVVELDEGGELQVVRQNLEMSSQEALEQRGRRVRVGWHGEHAYAIPDSQEQPRRRDEVDWKLDDGAGWSFAVADARPGRADGGRLRRRRRQRRRRKRRRERRPCTKVGKGEGR